MAVEIVNSVGANVPSQDLNGPQVTSSVSFQEKYGEERDKRYRVGVRQYIDPSKSEKYKHFLDDPWVEEGTPVNRPVQDSGRTKVLIVGGGFGGMLFAVRLIQAGFKVHDLLIVEPAGGFGGTWYWNRYPGLMCDTESYIYLPLLEEMNYMPTRKYADGSEIRRYAESIATKYNLRSRAQFQSATQTVKWDASTNEWVATILEKPKGGSEAEITVRAESVLFASGRQQTEMFVLFVAHANVFKVLSNAKLPDIEGVDAFKGHSFHTARWDYKYTGGSPEKPDLTALKDKRVAYLGTGATAVQSIPHLAKWAKELYIFQRTPSAVDRRDNRDTDVDQWKKEIATGKGWQRERSRNFHAFTNNAREKPSVNLVNDEWTRMPSYSALVGSPREVTMENVVDYVGELHALDYTRSERVRKRCEQIVEDEVTAKALQAWYPGWCKRPCFHDEYLQAFNSPNVCLIDTDGKGVSKVTATGPAFNGKLYDVDVIIWGTGFVSPFLGSPAGKASVQVFGRDGVSLESRNDAGDLSTFHGALSRDFPNMFWPGPLQTGVSPNFVFALDMMSTHIAHIIAEATKKVGGKAIIEPSEEAQEQWGMQIAMGAAAFAGMAGCTPGYLNMEGQVDKIPPEMRMKAARKGIWAAGVESFSDTLESWRTKGGLEGLEVTAAA